MTREDAAAVLKDSKQQNEIMRDNPSTFWAPSQMADGIKNAEKRITALDLAISALRAPTREIVEKMRGEWAHTHSTDNFWTEVWKCSHCGFEDDNGDCFDFCPECGQPKTGEAVDMMLERWKEAADGEAEAD